MANANQETTQRRPGTQVQTSEPAEAKPAPVLRLRLEPRKEVQWEEEVVDNEGMGRKKSKRCCIYHKPRKFGESDSDESSSDMDDEEREKYWSQSKPGRPAAAQMYHA